MESLGFTKQSGPGMRRQMPVRMESRVSSRAFEIPTPAAPVAHQYDEGSEMSRIKRSRLAELAIAAAVLLIGCTSPPVTSGPQAVVSVTIECQVFYRASTNESLSESKIRLTSDGDVELIEFDDLGFNASYIDDGFEARSLVISITNLDSGDEIARQLNQMDRGKNLINQFIGGHGFTGLIYVFHPSSPGELQYFCEST